MSTVALICAKDERGKIRGSYCHWDGYPSHVGRILEERYGTDEAVKALMELGDLSSLGVNFADEPGGQRDERGNRYDTTVAYCRDRHERFRRFFVGDSLDECPLGDFDYVYLYEDGAWRCRIGGKGGTFMSVAEAIARYEPKG